MPGLQPENSTSRASHVLKGEGIKTVRLVWWVDIRCLVVVTVVVSLFMSFPFPISLVLKTDLHILEQKHDS